MSLSLLAYPTTTRSPSALAVTCKSGTTAPTFGLAGLTRRPMVFDPGTSSRNTSSRFAASATCTRLIPVALPPGLFKLLTRLRLTGSAPMWKTMGIVGVEFRAAAKGAVPPTVMMIATCCLTKSAARPGNLASCPSAQRNSIATLRPSTKPVSLNPRRIADTFSAYGGAGAAKMPITGIGGCCAAVATGQAAAPLSSVMNSRRLMSGMGTSSPICYQAADGPARSAFRHLSLPQRGRLVLGVDLNRSESRQWPAAQRASSQTRIAHGERLYSFGDVRVATLALLIFTALSGWCSWGVVMTKFSGHVITFRSSPTVFADTPVPTSASTRILAGKPPRAMSSAAVFLHLYRGIWSSLIALSGHYRAA